MMINCIYYNIIISLIIFLIPLDIVYFNLINNKFSITVLNILCIIHIFVTYNVYFCKFLILFYFLYKLIYKYFFNVCKL